MFKYLAQSVFVCYSKKIYTPQKLHNLFLLTPEKLAWLSLLKEVEEALYRSQNDKTSNINLITCFHHYNILAKTCRRMTTALCFSASMTMVNACTQLRPEKSCPRYSHLCLLCFMLFNKFNFLLDIIVIKVPYITGLISVYHMAGCVSSQDDQRQLLCSDSATQIQGPGLFLQEKLFFQQFWYKEIC